MTSLRIFVLLDMGFTLVAFNFLIREGNFKCIPRLGMFNNFLSRTVVKISAIWEDSWCGRMREADEVLARTHGCAVKMTNSWIAPTVWLNKGLIMHSRLLVRLDHFVM